MGLGQWLGEIGAEALEFETPGKIADENEDKDRHSRRDQMQKAGIDRIQPQARADAKALENKIEQGQRQQQQAARISPAAAQPASFFPVYWPKSPLTALPTPPTAPPAASSPF